MTTARTSLAGDPGEIWVRGQNVFAGYWDDPEATERVLVDGWLRTGDVAVADDDGYLSLVDRKKDLVIVSGFNVFPAEVEEVLLAHPDIADAAVIGVPNPRTGEAGRRVGRVGARREPHGRAGAGPRRAPPRAVQGPGDVEIVDALPRNEAGKLLRRELRDLRLGASRRGRADARGRGSALAPAPAATRNPM